MKQTAARKAYLAINIIFTGVILLVMGYSLFYSPEENKYPVICIHEKLTGEPCPSCGMSHAFSLIVRGRVNEALKWNSVSLRVFSFFAVQLFMRIALMFYCICSDRNLRKIYITDTVLSSALTLTAFYPFLRAIWLTLFS